MGLVGVVLHGTCQVLVVLVLLEGGEPSQSSMDALPLTPSE
jgi:hypothetical protein